jgi:alpha-D-ribose 1-methylphosphonate 5-phosphate C-P lyase
MPALQIFGAGREKRIYAVPPYTKVKCLDFEDYPFEVERWNQICAFCGSNTSFLDEIIIDDRGTKLFICSDTDYCSKVRTQTQVSSPFKGLNDFEARAEAKDRKCA